MLLLHHSSWLTSLPASGLITVLALLCISSLTTASPVQPSSDARLAKRAPVPGSVNSTPGPLLVANEEPARENPPASPFRNPQAISGAIRLPTIPSDINTQGVGPVPACDGKAPTDHSLYPTSALADRWVGRSLEALCRERDPGPNCACTANPQTLEYDLQCLMVGRFFPTLDHDWHTSGVMNECRTKCRCPGVPTEPVPPGSPRTPLGPRPPSLGQRPSRDMSGDLDSIV